MAEPAAPWAAPDLAGRVAVVTGASRGVGKGIAEVLGECGATVYVTGRSTRATPGAGGAPGTVDETAELVTSAGGLGIAAVCDHGDERQVAALFARVKDEQGGRLDLLVNNAWGGYEEYDPGGFTKPFWEQSAEYWGRMIDHGARFQYLAARHAAPLMIARAGGLIIGTAAGDRGRYLGNLVYDVAKSAVARMAFGMATELRPHGVAALTLLPGFTRTEAVLALFTGDLSPTHSTQYVGRAVAMLAADADVMRHSGESLRVSDVAKRYGFVDVDGRWVPPFELPE
jgi:NAD(P)-dependent dehydrogenase (short-subunit alcohol dehydrogenase family)